MEISPHVRRLAPFLALMLLAGCVRRADEPFVLKCVNKNLTVELWQNARRIDCHNGVCRLAPGTFSMRLEGDVRGASFYASTEGLLERKLDRGEQPVVLAEGTRSARFPNDIWVHGEADEQTEVAEFHAATKNFFMRIPWGASEPEAETLVAFLKREFGANTLVATFRHYSFPHEGKTDAADEFLENFTRLPDGRVQGNFIVKHISSLPGTDVRSFRLLIFLESPVAKDINEFSWKALTIRFERGKARPVKP